jgi:hypothetical protein
LDLEERLLVMLCADVVECKVDKLRDWDAARLEESREVDV